MGCAEGLVKFILFTSNFIFALGGLALLGLGVAAQLKVTVITDLIDGHLDVMPISTMALGGIIFVISFCGCCGAMRESNCMLITYSILMLILVILKLTLAIVIFINLSKIDTEVSRVLQRAFEASNRQPFHEMEKSLECCGTGGPDSYLNISLPLPSTCCPSNITSAVVVISNCTRDEAFAGCTGLVTDFLRVFGVTIGSVIIAVVAIELVAVVFGCCLASHVRNKERRTRY